MGLAAVVYLDKENIKIDFDKDALRFDDRTGEVYVDDIIASQSYPEDMFIAIYKNLGNIMAIAEIRKEIIDMSHEESSVLLEKVLYSGSHSGDIIEVKDLTALEFEINMIKGKTVEYVSDNIVILFLQSMEELVQAAKKQVNPIVFI